MRALRATTRSANLFRAALQYIFFLAAVMSVDARFHATEDKVIGGKIENGAPRDTAA